MSDAIAAPAGWPLNRRAFNAAGFVICAAMMAYALYEQHFVGLTPCHLCILQRVAVIVLGVVFLLAALHNPGRAGARLYGIALAVVAMAGMIVAGRHVWLQQQPPGSVPACGADLSFMLKILPWQEVLVKVFKGGAECQTVDWSLLGLTMPAWVLIALAALGGTGLWANWRRTPDSRSA